MDAPWRRVVSCETPERSGETRSGESLFCSAWFWRLQDRAATLEPEQRAPALLRLAPQLCSSEPLAAAVAALTVAGVFPRSWPKRVDLAEIALFANTVDEVVTAVVAWCERGRRPVWITAVLADKSAPQRHAARRRDYVQVGRPDLFRQAGIVQLVEGSVRTVDEMLKKTTRPSRSCSVDANGINCSAPPTQ